MEVLTGLGLASAAGLNAYIPLLLLGLAARYTEFVSLPATWAWLADPWAIGIVGALLVVETLADKVPGVDHVNDLLQTVVRPAAGGIVVSAGASGTALVDDASGTVDSGQWAGLIAGAVVALLVHLAKAGGRAVVNATTAGVGAPVVSVAEDVLSIGLVVAALLLPVLVLVLLAVLITSVVRARRRRRLRRAQEAAVAVPPVR